MEAIMESGTDWEREVLNDRLNGTVHIAPGDGEVTERFWGWKESLQILNEATPDDYIYQPTLHVPDCFYRRYGLDQELIHITDNRPDLLQVYADHQGRKCVRVIDIKRGRTLKLAYRVQVLLYALELDAISEQWALDFSVDLDHGAAWLGRATEPELFGFDGVRIHLERFLARDLPNIISKEAQDVGWHLRFRCEWCEYFDHCRSKMEEENNISRLSGLTTYGKRFLETEHGVKDLEHLRDFLNRDNVDTELKRSASLVGQRPRLLAQLKAYDQQEPIAIEAYHQGLPIGENIALFITLQDEPLGEQTYLVGMLAQGSAELRKTLFGEEGKAYPFVLVAKRSDQVNDIHKVFIERLYEVLHRVHVYNEGKDWIKQLTLQPYTFTEKERLLLNEILFEYCNNITDDPRLAEKAIALLFYFQAPDLMLSEDHPSSPVAWPLIPLASALGRLVALPVDVSYTLPEALQSLGSTLKYSRSEHFSFPLGHGMRADPIHQVWSNEGELETLNQIRKEAAIRLFAIRSLLRKLRERLSPWIVHWPPRFRMIKSAKTKGVLLSKLAFLTSYESLLRCQSIRSIRSQSRETLQVLGKLIELEVITNQDFAVVGHSVELDDDGFPNWLLVRDSVDGARAQVSYPDYSHRRTPWGGGKDHHVAVVSIKKVTVDPLGYVSQLTVEWARHLKKKVKSGERFLLLPRFSDFTTDKVLSFIRKLDAHPIGIFPELIKAPNQASKMTRVDHALISKAQAALPSLRFTDSQSAAWQRIIDHRVISIWGPPGTGKTHFLASAVVGLAIAHAALGRSFHVLVTAFTHAAIENLLTKIHERSSAIKPKLQLAIGKAEGWRTQSREIAETVSALATEKWLMSRPISILGGTAYSSLKESGAIFDLVLIDEASQFKVPEASIPVTRMKTHARLVLAGDHLQLGPILAGIYPEPPLGEPILHNSIFDLVRGDEHRPGAPVCQLLENFRMNDVLTSFSARLLYGAQYRCATTNVAQRRLSLKKSEDDLSIYCLNPDYPLVVAILDGVIAAKENRLEASLVADLTVALREAMSDVKDDRSFFEDDLFIVSPHHAQIRAIRQELSARRDWSSPPFVDTVDKMQGQEAQAVLISYGVSDPEYAMREADFIYSVNRLNVAITRAQKKCIVFLPRPLLDATPEILDHEGASAGLAYMRRLVKLCEEHGENRTFSLEGDASLSIIRTRVVI
jgi:DNA replication ATP-dependent helicase Dna2